MRFPILTSISLQCMQLGRQNGGFIRKVVCAPKGNFTISTYKIHYYKLINSFFTNI